MPAKYDVLAEFKKVKNIDPICLFGSKESKSLYNLFKDADLKIKILPGGHHFNYDYEGISASMISELGK